MWITFDESQGTMLIFGDDRYFIVQDSGGGRFIAPAICPHRGGPLYMGTIDGENSCIRCPWHDMATPIKSLARKALPSVCIGSRWTVRLPEDQKATECYIMPVEQQQITQQVLTRQCH